MAVLKFGMGSFEHSGTPFIGKRNITLNRTNPVVPGTWDGCYQSCIVTVILKDSDWFGTNGFDTDWSYSPGIFG